MATKAKTTTKVGTTERVPLSEIRLLTKNPRKGNVGAVMASLRANTQYRPLVVNLGTHTGRPNEVLKGNHTLKALRALAKKYPEEQQWHTALVHWVDYDEDQLQAVVLVDNKSREGGSYDNDELVGLLSGMDDLAGTGFTKEDLDALMPAEEKFTPEVDPAALVDPEPDPEPEQFSGRGTQVIAYSIVFDTTAQRAVWTDFMAWLRRKYPDNTAAERLDLYLHDVAEDLEER